MKIATILPYKENYTVSRAQAAAIWVCDFFKFSKFKDTNFIFGYTDNKLLTCLKTNGDILWSTKIFNLSSNISPKYDEDEIGTISSLVLANNNIMLFSSKGYLLEFNSKNGQIISINKISKNGFVTDPIFSEGNMMVFNSKYKLLIFN